MITLKLAQREIKNNLRYWLFFAVNLAIGLLGFTFIFLFRDNVTTALESRAKALLTSDMAITGRRALAEGERDQVHKYLKGKAEEISQLTEMYSMVKPIKLGKTKSRLTLVKVIENNYPLYGSIVLDSDEDFSPHFLEYTSNEPYVFISREVAHQLKVDDGDSLKIGEKEFKIRGVIKTDSTSGVRGFNLAPKIYIQNKYLKETGLVGFGTVAWHTTFIKFLPNINPDQVKEDLEKVITDPAIKVKVPKNSSEQLGRVIGYLSDYLGLIGVVALLISCVGASYLYQNYIHDRIRQIGILKSLGVTRTQILTSFMTVAGGFGLISAIISVLTAKALLPLGLNYLEKYFAGEFVDNIGFDLFGTVVLIGVFINFLVCPPILLRLFKNKTVDLLNMEVSRKTNFLDYLYYIPALLFLWGVSVWQAHSFKIGTIFTLSLILIFTIVLFILPIVLNFLSKALVGRRLSVPFSLKAGVALRLMSRNKLSTVLTILCMAIGVSLVSVIAQIDKGLKEQLLTDSATRPSLFMFDIQSQQQGLLVNFAKENQIPMNDPTPMVRARLIKKNGETITRMKDRDGFSTREEDTERRFNNRGVNLSYAKGLNSSETITEGKPFSGDYSGEGVVEVSLETRYARRLNVGVGDTLTYDVLGVEFEGKIVNLRKIRWTSFLPNFFSVIQPGVLDQAPKTFLAVVNQVDKERELEIQDMIVENFSNISILSVSEIITKLLNVFQSMAWAIGLMSFCCIFVGGFVLYSILQSQIQKKQVDLALQKLMGLNEGSILRILLNEYLLMIFVSLFIGNMIGVSLSLIISHLFLDGIFVFNWEFFTVFNLAVILLSIGVILFSFKTNYKKTVSELLFS